MAGGLEWQRPVSVAPMWLVVRAGALAGGRLPLSLDRCGLVVVVVVVVDQV